VKDAAKPMTIAPARNCSVRVDIQWGRGLYGWRGNEGKEQKNGEEERKEEKERREEEGNSGSWYRRIKKERAEFLGATKTNFDENPESGKKSDSGFHYMGEL